MLVIQQLPPLEENREKKLTCSGYVRLFLLPSGEQSDDGDDRRRYQNAEFVWFDHVKPSSLSSLTNGFETEEKEWGLRQRQRRRRRRRKKDGGQQTEKQSQRNDEEKGKRERERERKKEKKRVLLWSMYHPSGRFLPVCQSSLSSLVWRRRRRFVAPMAARHFRPLEAIHPAAATAGQSCLFLPEVFFFPSLSLSLRKVFLSLSLTLPACMLVARSEAWRGSSSSSSSSLEGRQACWPGERSLCLCVCLSVCFNVEMPLGVDLTFLALRYLSEWWWWYIKQMSAKDRCGSKREMLWRKKKVNSAERRKWERNVFHSFFQLGLVCFFF